MSDTETLAQAAQTLRYWSIRSTTAARSGHASSSLSAAELMAVLMCGGHFHYDVRHPHSLTNDRLIFSKGHASPLYYALWAVAGAIPHDKLLTLRQFDSVLEGHPTMAFPYTDSPTGSLGQGLGFGVGLALAAQYLDETKSHTYVLLGDSEMAEGSVWEALEIANYYHLHNITAIIDVNRLGQRGETMLGYDVETYRQRLAAFGWHTIIIDGHDIAQIQAAYTEARETYHKPVAIIAKTVKGKGIRMMEDQDGWHGKPIPKESLDQALAELGPVDPYLTLPTTAARDPRSESRMTEEKVANNNTYQSTHVEYEKGKEVSTREAYGDALAQLVTANPSIIVLDAEVSNSTFASKAKEVKPKQFFEMFIAEQNMVSIAAGIAATGRKLFVSTFASFLTRAYDQIRMNGYARSDIVYVGSHAGVSIGADGPSQMGLEDIAMMRTITESTVLYPSDTVSTAKLVHESAHIHGPTYIRTTRDKTPIIYSGQESFPIGGSKVHTFGDQPYDYAIIAAGITLHEALVAQQRLHEKNIHIAVVDLYSIKPIDTQTLTTTAKKVKGIITVEDHRPEGGIGEAVRSALKNSSTHIESLAVTKIPRSGTMEKLLAYEQIDAKAIVETISNLLVK